MKKYTYCIGMHVSIAGGFENAIKIGTEINCTALQIFTKSNRQWASKAITIDDANLFIQAQKNSKIKIVISHASYLINLGSITPGVQEKSYRALVDEINRCSTLDIPYLVLHPGTAEKNTETHVLKKTGQLIHQALKETAQKQTSILIETMAGQGKSIGHTFEQLALILDQIEDKNRIGVCFDTCHVFAAGYDFTSSDGYEKTFKHFDTIIGLSYLKAFHLNDSKKQLGSRVDRHENIGQGLIEIKAFETILNDPRFRLVPKILETPHAEDLENDKKNLQLILSLLK